MLGLQASINIAVATVSVPTKGLSLPLISAGGSGLIITCAALGVLYSVARVGAAATSEPDDEPAQGEGADTDDRASSDEVLEPPVRPLPV
jgi:cell division protein FtsW